MREGEFSGDLFAVIHRLVVQRCAAYLDSTQHLYGEMRLYNWDILFKDALSSALGERLSSSILRINKPAWVHLCTPFSMQ